MMLFEVHRLKVNHPTWDGIAFEATSHRAQVRTDSFVHEGPFQLELLDLTPISHNQISREQFFCLC